MSLYKSPHGSANARPKMKFLYRGIRGFGVSDFAPKETNRIDCQCKTVSVSILNFDFSPCGRRPSVQFSILSAKGCWQKTRRQY